MPITALPQNTVRAIGSTSVITDPCSIVKELLDNALDASASSVFVEISQNTLDVIQVKDNGHGIQSEDHAVVCKRTFTSKIQTVEDLRNIGGKTLGFRGEALASTAEMSGGLTVSTRAGVESVGSSIKYGRNGELISSQRVSHPVGTTVRITDFLKHIPVRKQTALKSAGKTLSKIKKLLQTYAICHPTKRLSLKVIKAKNESNNWMHAGVQNANLMDAALKIAGTEVASHCMIKQWPSDENNDAYKLVALLPKQDTGTQYQSLFESQLLTIIDLTKVNNAGQYFSVDGRPLSSGRGLARDITKIYRKYLRSANSEYETTITDPFLCLQIQCPSASYDVNIEPAKDDVLFEDPQRVLSLADDLFRDMYGESTEHTEKRESSKKGKERLPNNDGFELLMARKSPIPPTTHRETTNNTPEPSLSMPSLNTRRPSPRSSGFTQMEHDTSYDEGHEGGRDLEGLNPWSAAKLNAPFRTPMKAQAGPSMVPVISHTTRREPLQIFRGAIQNSPASSKSSAVPSPPTSNSNPNSTSTSPTDTRFSPSVQNPQTSPTVSMKSSTKRARERDRERYGNGALDTFFEKITQAGLRQNEEHQSETEDVNEEEQEPPLTQLAQARFGSSDQSQSDTGSAGDLFTQDDSGDTQMTPGPSAQDLESPSRHSNPTHSRKGLPVMEKWSSNLYQSSEAPHNAELEKALDFEHRKKEAVLKYREEKRNRLETSGSTNSPHHSRYLAAKASLNSESNKLQSQASLTSEESVSKPTLSPFDPRAYLIRQNDNQQQIPKDGKARRIQTGKLPFENIPEGYDLHNVLLTMPLSASLLSSSIKENLKHDLYTQSGTDFEAFTESGSELPFDIWRYRLSDLINKTYRTREPGAPSLDFDFSTIHHLSELQH